MLICVYLYQHHEVQKIPHVTVASKPNLHKFKSTMGKQQERDQNTINHKCLSKYH